VTNPPLFPPAYGSNSNREAEPRLFPFKLVCRNGLFIPKKGNSRESRARSRRVLPLRDRPSSPPFATLGIFANAHSSLRILCLLSSYRCCYSIAGGVGRTLGSPRHNLTRIIHPEARFGWVREKETPLSNKVYITSPALHAYLGEDGSCASPPHDHRNAPCFLRRISPAPFATRPTNARQRELERSQSTHWSVQYSPHVFSHRL